MKLLAPSFAVVATALCLPGTLVIAENIDPDIDDSQYAYAENVGWINAEPNGNGADGIQVADFQLSGWLWGENTGWISLSCLNTSSCGTVSYGVTNDGHGNLGGFAWAENAGWVNFAPSTSSASIDPTSGGFSGYVWSENLGWVSLSCANTGTCGTVDYGIKTDWCQSVVAAPSGEPEVGALRVGSDVELSWPALSAADWYEIVRGTLSALRASGGDYSTATESCATDNETGTTAVVSGTPEPGSGDGYWYLVRGVNCKGKGSWDTGASSQVDLRDDEIAASGNDCP